MRGTLRVVELTEHGRTTLEQATRASDRAEEELLAGLGTTDAAKLRSTLARIAESGPQ